MVTALRLSGLLPHVVKYRPTSEKAALPGDLELKRIGARDLFKEVGGGACSIFKEKESIMGIYYTLDLGGCQRKRSTLLLRGRYCKPVARLHVFCSNCLPSRGSSALEQPHQQWDAFPPLPPLPAGPTNPSFPRSHLPALRYVPWFLQTRGHCSLCSE